MELTEFRNAVVAEIGHHYNLNDPAHKLDHVQQVCDRALELNAIHLRNACNEKEIVVAALVHDLFTNHREMHHKLAGFYIRNTTAAFMDEFSGVARDRIALAVERHRASYKGRYDDLLEELIATADRPDPTSLLDLWKTAVRTGLGRGMEKDEAFQNAYDHVRAKFGRRGYCLYPPLYLQVWSKEMEALFQEIDQMVDGQFDSRVEDVEWLYPQGA